MSPRCLAIGALALLLAGCVSGDWSRTRAHARVRPATLEELEPGASLERCLAVLGAPNDVWETPADGVALAWWWVDARGWGVTASVPLNDYGSASATWRDDDSPGRGVVLFFDAGLVLTRRELGGLVRAGDHGRRRPDALEEAGGAADPGRGGDDATDGSGTNEGRPDGRGGGGEGGGGGS